MSQEHNTSEEKLAFNQAEQLVFNEYEKAFVNKKGNLVNVNGWLLYMHEARALRDWLNEVIP